MVTSHVHRSVSDWILRFEETDDQDTVLASCPRAREAWCEGLGRWLEHVASCSVCQEVARGQESFADASLDCPECRANLEMVHRLVDEAEHYEPATAWELERGERFLDELRPLPLAEQTLQVRAEPCYQQWGFAQRLLLDARDAWHNDPERAHDRALLAIVVAGELDPRSYGAAWIADLEAKAHAYLGNAHRIIGDFLAAETEFALAERCLHDGVGSGLAEARVFALKASLLNDQHRHREALALLADVERIYEARGERHEVGRIALKRGHVLFSSGAPEGAAEECARAAAALDPARHELLPLLARKNAIEYTLAAGEVDRARSLFDQLPRMPGMIAQLRRSWLEANLLRTEGRFADACTVYQEVRQGFAEAGLHYDAALACLDQSVTAFEESGHTHPVRLMAQEATLQLTLAGAKQEAFLALRILLRAVREDAVTFSILEGVRRRVAALQPS